MGMLQEFREFAVRGNVVDMAVGVIMGAAFGKITTSLVNDVMMPPLGMMLGGVDFSDKAVVLRAAEGTDPGVMVKYGIFVNTLIDFAIVALAVFLLVKGINSLRRQQAAAPAPPPAPTPTEVLLTEIRDTLRARS
jgi:large conductance mechanosensitive channel